MPTLGKPLIAFMLLWPLLSFSQIKGEVVIDWIPSQITAGQIAVPLFKSDSYDYNPYLQKLQYSLKLQTSAELDKNNIQLFDIVFENIAAKDLGNLDPSQIPTTLQSSLYSSRARNQIQNFLRLSPIIKEGSTYKRIKSFSYSVQPSKGRRQSALQKKSLLSNSVLASGEWYRFYVEKSGVYKISREFLQELGLNLNGLNPQRIKLYGNGGKMLPLANSDYYPMDLSENAILIQGENDGQFDTNDYILFYAEGVYNWNEESQTNLNLYDSKSYYYLTIGQDNGKRIQPLIEPSSPATLHTTNYDEHQFHEQDLSNIAQVGRQWVGESFEINNQQEFTFNFPNIDPSAAVKLKLKAASAAYTPTAFKIAANAVEVGTLQFPALNPSADTRYYNASLPANTQIAAATTIKIGLSYNNNAVPGSKGYLDYIQLIAKCKLQGIGKQYAIQYDLSASSTGILSYDFTNAAAITQIWDISDLYNISKKDVNNLSSFSLKAALGQDKKYIVIDPNDYYTPLKESKTKIGNSNIKGSVFKNSQNQFQDIDYIIITPEFLLPQAEKLAQFHRGYSQLQVKTISLEAIYQEFSSGKQDIAAIRNCIKYIYQNASSADKQLKYVNLFGDASYDYKKRISNNSNIVPIYESLISNTAGELSYASDDFYGLMDEEEGNIGMNFGGSDIAIGRMLLSSNAQAEDMVNKILQYHQPEALGNWRNNFVMCADDSDQATDANLQSRQNILADEISKQKPFLNLSKILLDSYVQEASAGGQRYPKAKAELYKQFEKGSLVINYLGHGGEDVLASERLWDRTDSQAILNPFKYPLFITITCDFSRFDNPSRPTGGEYIYWNAKGGAISLISTIRSIGQFSAENFNDVFAKNLLSFGSNNYVSIAEALRLSKNENPNSASNVILYIGDPALYLAIPKPKVLLTKVNGIPLSQAIPDFSALKKMTITGEITDENNQLLSNYNGLLSSILFDKQQTKTTLNNDGFSPAMNFTSLGAAIFRGNATVSNGQFEYSFVVPKDIRIALDYGKLSFYAQSNEKLPSVSGYDSSIKVGGINENPEADNSSPKISLYMNDQNFVSGGITNDSPIFIAQLQDESGINTAGGIGHDIVAILDGDLFNPIVLNDYYQTDLDDYTKGNLQYPLKNLSPGLHSISFTVWDVYNNASTSEIQFLVTTDQSLTLSNVLNYPNPCVNYTEFWFTHNKPYEPLEVQVQVLSITGKVIWTKNQWITNAGFLSRDIKWDTRDDFGNKIGKGVYIYKLTVKTISANLKAEKYEKLVIL